jgi:hypothetical protein
MHVVRLVASLNHGVHYHLSRTTTTWLLVQIWIMSIPILFYGRNIYIIAYASACMHARLASQRVIFVARCYNWLRTIRCCYRRHVLHKQGTSVTAFWKIKCTFSIQFIRNTYIWPGYPCEVLLESLLCMS